VPRAQWATTDFGQHPIGAGPFKLQSWEKSQRIVLVRNPDYYVKDRPYLDRIVFQIVADPSNRVRMLAAGQIDLVDGIPEREAARWQQQANAPVRVQRCRGRDYDYLVYNPHDSLFANVAVREALTRAIDREALVRDICLGFAELLDGPIPPMLWGCDPNLPRVPHDPAGARSRLAALGWRDTDGDGWLDKDGKRFEFELQVANDVERRRNAVVPIQSDWKAIGVKAEVRVLEKETARAGRESGKFQVALAGWSTNLAHDVDAIWGCGKRRNNFIGFCDARVDSLNAAQLLLPPDAAKPLIWEIQRRIAAAQPYTWLYAPQSVVGTAPRLHDVLVDRRGAFINPDAWWVDDAQTAR
jgi:peptide/nickel transport system substrate-binding protein